MSIRLAILFFVIGAALCTAEPLGAHPFDKVVPRIHVTADLTTGRIVVEYIFEYRTLDASLEEQTKPEVGLDANGDSVISEQERRTRVAAYCAEVQAQARLLLNGAAVGVEPDLHESDAYKLRSADEIEGVGNWLLGYVLVLRSAPLGPRFGPGKHTIHFHNEETRLQRSTALADSMRGIVKRRDARLGRVVVSDAFDRTFDVWRGRFDRIRFAVEVGEEPWQTPSSASEVDKVDPPAPEVDVDAKPSERDPGEVGEPDPPASKSAVISGEQAQPSAVDRARASHDPTPKTQSEKDNTRLAALIEDVKGGGLATLLAIIGFFLWGAWHAIQPGHGKSLVASYLIGTHGRPRDAITLGITVTLAHVSGVFVFLGAYLLLEKLAPELVSRSFVQDAMIVLFGVIIFLMGISLILKASGGGGHQHDIFGRHVDGDHHHDHDHGHDHDHDHDHGHGHSHHHHPHKPPVDPAKLTTAQIIRLGILGGMLPCPAAVTLALWMITQGEALLGMGLLLVFSMGLAAVLSGIGLVMVATKGYMVRKQQEGGRLFHFARTKLPVFGGLAIALIGFTMLLTAAHRLGLLNLSELMI